MQLYEHIHKKRLYTEMNTKNVVFTMCCLHKTLSKQHHLDNEDMWRDFNQEWKSVLEETMRLVGPQKKILDEFNKFKNKRSVQRRNSCIMTTCDVVRYNRAHALTILVLNTS